MKTGTNHPNWALKYRKPGTELKFINGRYYLYGVKSVYDQTIKKSRKVSLGILGSITEDAGFRASEKNELKKKSSNTYLDRQLMVFEYKSRGETGQFFDHLKNTIDASCSHMQRSESLNGWMFINHISIQTIYKLFQILKTTPLNKNSFIDIRSMS
jgi:hypothetical protein